MSRNTRPVNAPRKNKLPRHDASAPAPLPGAGAFFLNADNSVLEPRSVRSAQDGLNMDLKIVFDDKPETVLLRWASENIERRVDLKLDHVVVP